MSIELENIFSQVPAQMKKDNSIPDGAKILFGDIAYICKNEKRFRLSDSKIAEAYGISERTAKYWIKKLEDAGYITKSRERNPETGLMERVIVAADIELYAKQAEREQEKAKKMQKLAELYAKICNDNIDILSIKDIDNMINTLNSLNKIHNQKTIVKHNFKNNFEQRQYSSDFDQMLLAKMSGGGSG